MAAWTPAPADPMALTDILVGPDRLAGFDPHRYHYDITLDADAVTAAQVTPVSGGGTQALVTQATGLPGTATVTTFRLDGNGNRIYGPTYQVRFRVPGRTGRSLPVVSVSASADDGNGAANTLDGDMGTRWSADGDGQHVTYDLGTQRDLAAVNIAFYNGHLRRSTLDVLTSMDGTTWRTALARATSSGTTDNPEVFGFTPTTARYLRIVGTATRRTRTTASSKSASTAAPPTPRPTRHPGRSCCPR